MENSYSVIEFENGRNYILVDEVEIEEKKYMFLVNESDNNDLLFQNVDYTSETPKISKIESPEEFDVVSNYFGKKYRRIYG